MTTTVSRRSLLTGAAALAAAPAATGSFAPTRAAGAPVATTGAALPVPTSWRVQPFALGEVSLGRGIFAQKSALMLDHARGYDVNRLLQVFRANAGLDTLGAVAPGGWEGLDGEANGNLRGHYTGHFLSMLSQAYASTKEPVFADKIGTIVGALGECREALQQTPQIRTVPGVHGEAITFARGSYTYLSLPSGAVNGQSTVTISAWVRPVANGSWSRILDIGNDTTTYLYLTTANAQGVPRFAITRSGAGGEQALDAAAALELGVWAHVAVTLDGSIGTLYVNGAVSARGPITLTPAGLGSLRDVWLGRSHYNDPGYAGELDEVHVWSRALSDAEIVALQSNSAASSPAGIGDLVALEMDGATGSTVADRSGRGMNATYARTWGAPSHPGFLAAYPETQFITLETMTSGNYTVVWAPYYTAHKILRGLVDAHLHTGNAQALELAAGMCDWMFSRLSRLQASTLQRMWGIFSSGEFGGIVEAICDVHALTGKTEYVQLARLFDLNSLLDNCAGAIDRLDGLHANQHIPILTGAVRLHDVTGDDRYLAAAKGFWSMVVNPRMFAIGGTSTGEFFKARGAIASTLSDVDAETCCAHNMLKLSRALFLHEPNPKYMDYYERALLNQVLGSKQDLPSAEHPLTTYFIGLNPGHVRDYTPKQGTTCCEGTGMESATKYQDSVFCASADNSALFVNLYSAATLQWQARSITVTQVTNYPIEQGSTLTVTGSGRFDLMLRVPSWATRGFAVRVNGKSVDLVATPGSYAKVARTWRSGDVVSVHLPFTLRTEATLDNPARQALLYGPVVLALRDPRTSYLSVSLSGRTALNGDLAPNLVPTGEPLHFTLAGIPVAPFYEGTLDPTHVYWDRVEPSIAFAGRDSAVPNMTGADGVTFLDTLWASAPFAHKTELLKAAARTVDAFVAAGRMSAEQGRTVLDVAKSATFVP